MRQLLACLFLSTLFFTTHTKAAAAAGSQLHSTNSLIQQRIERLNLPLKTSGTDARFQNKLRDFLRSPRGTARILGRSQRYFPIINEVFCELDVPVELRYLSVIESALNPRAVSHRGAAGLWQLMPATARSLGLRVDGYVDERMDPEKSTRAAGTMLKQLHDDLGDWKLVAASYNAGPARVRSAIRRAGSPRDFRRVKRYLPRETRNYIGRYTAAAYIFNYHASYNISAPVQAPAAVATFPIFKGQSLTRIARITGTKYRTLRRMNPSLRGSYIPTNRGGFTLRLPVRGLDTLRSTIWGKSHLVYTDAFAERSGLVTSAQVQGFNPTTWLLGIPEVEAFTPGAVYHRIVADWSEAWVGESAFAAA